VAEENKKEENLEKKEEEKDEEKEKEKDDNIDDDNKKPEKKKFFIDEDYVQILGIKMENKNLIAVVERKSNGIKKIKINMFYFHIT